MTLLIKLKKAEYRNNKLFVVFFLLLFGLLAPLGSKFNASPRNKGEKTKFGYKNVIVNEYMKDHIHTTWPVGKLKPEKKFRPERDSNPWPLRYRCSAVQCSALPRSEGPRNPSFERHWKIGKTANLNAAMKRTVIIWLALWFGEMN